MADRRRDSHTPVAPHGATHNGVNGRVLSPAQLLTPGSSPLVAAAQPLVEPTRRALAGLEPWQVEAWDFYDSLGEFSYGAEWLAEAMSRVRLVAAKVVPGGDEPEVLESGPAVDLVSDLVGGTDGQAQLLRSLGIQLSVPGEAYLVGREVTEAEVEAGVLLDAEPDEFGRVWTVQPANTLRQSNRRTGELTLFGVRRRRRVWEIQTEDERWTPLPDESLICRVWERHERWPWRAMSPAKPALPIMREIDMYNRRIIAELVSRVALNGLLFIPDEVTLPVNPAYQDAVDPFVSELLDIMRAAIRSPGSPAAAVPVPLRVPSEFIEKFRHMTFATPLDQKIFENRQQAIQRLATTLNLPTEIITGMGDTSHWCVDTLTEIYTRDRGWVTHVQLDAGDVVMTLDHMTGRSEWQPVLDIYRADVTDEPMVLLEGRGHTSHSSLTTRCHRWPVIDRYTGERSWATSNTRVDTDRVTVAAPAKTVPTEAKWSDALVELAAWVSTDGGVIERPMRTSPKVYVSQSHAVKPTNVASIRQALTTLYGPAVESLGSGGRGQAVNDVPQWRERTREGITTFLLNGAAGRLVAGVFTGRTSVSLDFIEELTHAQLELFIATCVRGDGTDSGVYRRFCQSDPGKFAAFERALILSGQAASYYACRHQDGFNPDRTMHWMHIIRASTIGRLHRSEVSYTGTVWCPVTPNGTWLARRNGKIFYTGNSAWQIEESAIKLHISPRVETVTRCLTIGYLHPVLQSLDESTRTKTGERIIVWYDVSELTQRPDRSGLAVQLREQLVITDEATRRETGFDEADAPTEDELERMILQKLAVNPQTAAPALKALTGLELEMPQPVPAAGASEDAGGPVGVGGGDGPPDLPPRAPTAGTPDTRGEPPPEPGEDAGPPTGR